MNQETYWKQLIEQREQPSHVRVNGSHYFIGPERPTTPRQQRGTRGDRYTIKFQDGRQVVTTNLWQQGPIPAQFREQLPDNAEFIKSEGSDARLS